jgi:hypothetical protein
VPQRLISWLGHQVPGVAGLAPAAGWIAPAAAAAAALAGISSHAIDHGPTRASGAGTPVAQARVAAAASARPIATPHHAASRDRATAPAGTAHRDRLHRRPRSPVGGGVTPAHTTARPGSSPTPAASVSSLPAAVGSASKAVGAAEVPAAPPPPVVDPAGLPVQAPALPALTTPSIAAVVPPIAQGPHATVANAIAPIVASP